MTVDLVLRVVCLLLSGVTAGFALVRAMGRHGLYRRALLALSLYALAATYGQISLIRDPITDRTVAGLVASLAGAVYVLRLVRRGPDDSSSNDSGGN